MKSFKITLCLFFALLSPVAAQPIPAEKIEAFLTRISDVEETLKLERAVSETVKRNDKKWFIEQAKVINRDDLPLMKRLTGNKDKLSTDVALRMGPCHYAGLMIRTVIRVGEANAIQNKPLSNATRSRPPESDDASNADDFAEQMQRCERVKRLPRSTRLIGKTFE
jgi:hypothetical protein